MKKNLSLITPLVLSILSFSMSTSCAKNKIGKIEFTKEKDPVWEGTLTAADPSIVRDGDTLRMYYSSLVIDGSGHEKLLIAGAKSVDGINWIPANGISGQESIALDVNAGQWDNHLEAVSVIKEGNEIWMYYCGYPVEQDVAGLSVANSQIGLAVSTNMYSFTRVQAEPLLEFGATNSMDANSLFSPTVIKENGIYYMFYVGYCLDNCAPAYIGLMGASSPDGVTWTKMPNSIMAGVDYDLKWAEVIKEPCLVKGPDNIFYMFFSGDKYLGVARSSNITGPYEVFPKPILKTSEKFEKFSVIAPTVLIENNKVRMWYMGVQASNGGADFAIGYAESDFPFDWK